MPEARDGDVAEYQQCQNPDCPAHREGYKHAHLVEVRRAPPVDNDSPQISPGV